MLEFSDSQMQALEQHATTRNVERLEAFMDSLNVARFAGLAPNARRELALRALRRAAQFGAHSVQAAGKVLLLIALFGENFDMRPRAEGGLFEDPAHIGPEQLDEVYEQVLEAPGLDAALRRAAGSAATA